VGFKQLALDFIAYIGVNFYIKSSFFNLKAQDSAK
jgi:hypothetical protein